MKKIILVFFLMLSYIAFAEDKVIVKSYTTLISENTEYMIEQDAIEIIIRYEKRGYEFISMDMAGTERKIFVAYRFRKE